MTFSPDFEELLLGKINKRIKGSFYGTSESAGLLKSLVENVNPDEEDQLVAFLNAIIDYLKTDMREGQNGEARFIDDQIPDLKSFYTYLFSLDCLNYNYHLKLDDKQLENLFPGEKGSLLLVFYLLLDMDDKPLILDQPEDNLDNESVAKILVRFIKKAKKRRQIIMVTHNPNLAVVADAEQIIYVNIDKTNENKFSYASGSIENPNINNHIVDVLEGAMPAFNQRRKKYYQVENDRGGL